MFISDYLFLMPELYLTLIVSFLLILGTSLTNRTRTILVTNFGYISIFMMVLFFFCVHKCRQSSTVYCSISMWLHFLVSDFA